MDEQQLRAKINQRLVETGEKERLKDVLRQKLIEAGWREHLKQHCRQIIQEKQAKSVSGITVEELVAEVTPYARANVPDYVKQDLLQRINQFIATHADQ